MSEIGRWLEQHGLSKYAIVLDENDVDVDVLSEITEQDLKDFGFSFGDRKRFLKAIRTPGEDLAPLPESTVDETLLQAPPAEAERRQLTVMFCDLVGSVELGERMDVEDYRDFLGRFRSAVVKAVEIYSGFVARHQGDGLLVYFGYPRAHENDAERAVRAALEVVEGVQTLDAPCDEKPQVRIGIATGAAIVGDILATGMSERSELAALGSTPNLAARLQGEAEPNSVVISETTQQLSRGLFDLEALTPRQMKGMRGAVVSYRVVSVVAGQSRFAARAGPSLSPFVGRTEEMELLSRRWSLASTGHGQVVAIVGEPGAGKSRLMQELREQVSAQARDSLALQCSPLHEHTPLFPAQSYFERILEFAPVDDGEARFERIRLHLAKVGIDDDEVLNRIADLLLLAPDNDAELSVPRRRQAILAALVNYVLGRTVGGPLLVAIEDAHWADPSMKEFLEHLAEAVETAPVLVIVTARSGFCSSWSDLPHARILNLSRLTRREGEIIARAAAVAVANLSSETLSDILSRASGNPLFIEELARLSGEQGVDPDQASIPSTLQDSLMARLDVLSHGKAVAQHAAVIGREFTIELLEKIWEGTAADLVDGLAELEQAGLVSLRAEGSAAQYVFKHALIQDAARDSLLRARRRTVHGRIGRALRHDQSGTTPPELIAHHFAESGEHLSAAKSWLQAAKRATKQSAYQEAVALYQQGLDAAESLPPDASVPDLLLALHQGLAGVISATKGYGSSEFRAALERAKELSEELQDSTLLWRTLGGLRRHYTALGEVGTARQLAVQALSLAQQGGDPLALMESHYNLGIAHFTQGEFGKAEKELSRAASLRTEQAPLDQLLATASTGGDVGLVAMVFLTVVTWFLGRPTDARKRVNDLRAINPHQHNTFTRAFLRAWSCVTLILLEDIEALGPCSEELLADSGLEGYELFESASYVYRSYYLAAVGETDKASRLLSSQGKHRVGRYSAFSPFYECASARIHLASNRLDAAISVMSHWSAPEDTSNNWFGAEYCRMKGWLLEQKGIAPSESVNSWYEHAVGLGIRQGAIPLALRAGVDLARALVHAGRIEEARRRLNSLQCIPLPEFDIPERAALDAAVAALD